jgi:hypothetical protein
MAAAGYDGENCPDRNVVENDEQEPAPIREPDGDD